MNHFPVLAQPQSPATWNTNKKHLLKHSRMQLLCYETICLPETLWRVHNMSNFLQAGPPVTHHVLSITLSHYALNHFFLSSHFWLFISNFFLCAIRMYTFISYIALSSGTSACMLRTFLLSPEKLVEHIYQTQLSNYTCRRVTLIYQCIDTLDTSVSTLAIELIMNQQNCKAVWQTLTKSLHDICFPHKQFLCLGSTATET